jgi:hypothetical protein
MGPFTFFSPTHAGSPKEHRCSARLHKLMSPFLIFCEAGTRLDNSCSTSCRRTTRFTGSPTCLRVPLEWEGRKNRAPSPGLKTT